MTRVIAKGLITNRNQSNKGTSVVGGVGARHASVISRIKHKAAGPLNRIIPQGQTQSILTPVLNSLVAINNGLIIYPTNIDNSINYECELSDGTNISILQVTVNYSGANYVVISGLQNGQQYILRMRGYNDQVYTDWSNSLINTPILTNGYYINTSLPALASIPLGAVVTYVIVGGGGGGGAGYDTGSGGGGGGGMVITGQFISSGYSYTITVGAGGQGGIGSSGVPRETAGSNGSDSSISGVIIARGGNGGYQSRANQTIGGAAAVIENGTPAQGGGGSGSDATGKGSGGGGGSSSAGATATSSAGGAGGAGTFVSLGIINGTYGVGGAGRSLSDTTAGTNAVNGTGNGGSGAGSTASDQKNGGNGGSGFVYLLY